ncbi:MAG: aminomethyl-transferring glycine dehydrogenase [Methylacidiphilales bacterium]|nr:aminomethyl-transferring glycine dehydrogenase [Candidatus Methylacidiphilales bacterium]
MHTTHTPLKTALNHPDEFHSRHIGPNPGEIGEMLTEIGEPDLESFISKVVPKSIRIAPPLAEMTGQSEARVLARLKSLAGKNKVFRSLIGQGYQAALVPPVIQRNILENPGWYTAYTPYQPEISQGRLEALLNFQTLICELTGLDIANASLLDEATAAAEAMTMAYAIKGKAEGRGTFFASLGCHPQTLAVLKTRAHALGLKVAVGCTADITVGSDVFGVLLQYPNTRGLVSVDEKFIKSAKEAGAFVVLAADILALTLLKPPGELGADVAVGSTQRFGMPLGFGGPHAAFFATRDEFKRQMPGRLIGVSQDSAGRKAMRLSLQTREQHIRHEKATSNICTAQVLPAVVASMYAVYHGPDGLRKIAGHVHRLARVLVAGLKQLGYKLEDGLFFDTLTLKTTPAEQKTLLKKALSQQINLRVHDDGCIGIALDEASTPDEVDLLLGIFNESGKALPKAAEVAAELEDSILETQRSKAILPHDVFHRHHSESEMLRYMKKLENKDISLTYSMIPLGSCTMKLNAAAEMYPVTWPEFANIHPLAPVDQTAGYKQLILDLEAWLAKLTGFEAVSLQPNAGSQGEYAGLLAIKAYHESIGQGKRHVCLIPQSAHGTNFASAVMAGYQVVVVACNAQGEIDLGDLKSKAEAMRDDLAALMVTYPSTHGVFEESIREICRIVHDNGGQVYMDGANMNAQVGLCSPGSIGADVCHLNLHKTFCIPHGGGGPGMGPICVAAHLKPFLPGDPAAADSAGAVSATNWGSGCILPISWVYIALMGGQGLARASSMAILNANYIAKRLEPYYPVLYKGKAGYVAHECILDLRPLKVASGVEVEDVAKRLMDYGFHAPTMSWPIPGTLMVEPTESESKGELDRFCDALISIRKEISQIEEGKLDRVNNPLKRAPHPAADVLSDAWDRPYSRELAVYPVTWLKENKYWPPVSRVDNVYGDRNLFCTCAMN